MAIETIYINFSWSVLLCFNNTSQNTCKFYDGESHWKYTWPCVKFFSCLVPRKAWSSLCCPNNQQIADTEEVLELTIGTVSGDFPPWKYDSWQVQYVSCPVVNLGLNRWISFWVDVNWVKAIATVFWLRHSKLKTGGLLCTWILWLNYEVHGHMMLVKDVICKHHIIGTDCIIPLKCRNAILS